MSLFSQNKIFKDSAVCAVLDRLMYEIEASLPGVAVNDFMCLTGRAAALLQGAMVRSCDNVIFITRSPEIYNFIKDVLPTKVKHTGVAIYKERSLFYFGQLYVEIWYQEGTLEILEASGIYVHTLAKIPTATL